MKCQTYSGWEKIEQDPLLRMQLNFLEQHRVSDELIDSLIEFYDMIDNICFFIPKDRPTGDGEELCPGYLATPVPGL